MKQLFIFILVGMSLFSQAHGLICMDITNDTVATETPENLTLRRELAAAGADFFSRFLRIPSVKELLKYAEMDIKEAKVTKIIGDKILFWNEAFAQNPRKIEDAKMVLLVAYHDFVKQSRTPGIAPRSATAEELYTQLIETYAYLEKANSRGDLKWKHLERILGMRPRQSGEVEYPVLFNGMDDLRRAAQNNFPNSFKGVRDPKYGYDYNRETLSQIVNKYNGFIAISILGGISWDVGKLEFISLKLIAEKRNLVILVKEINGETDFIPQEIQKDPRVRIVTNTIDFGDELRLWGGLVAMPTNANPLQGLQDGRVARTIGQTQIVFSTQRAMKTNATELNHIMSHDIWSTGTLNDPDFPYSNYRSSRVTTLASARLINSATIVEKSASTAGPNNRGAPGRWHIRAADFEKEVKDDRYGNWPAGTVDTFMFYPADGSAPRPIPAVAVVPGDYHSGFEDPRFIKAVQQQIFAPSRLAGAPIEYVRYHDFYDIGAASPYDSPTTKAVKQLLGEMNLQSEINRGRADINFLLAAEPQLNVIISEEDNHHVWLTKMFNDSAALNDPTNGPFLLSLRQMQTRGIGPIEFLMRRQGEFDLATPDIMVRNNLLNQNVYVDDPERIRVLRAGESFYVGPADRAVNIGPHGHKISGGARGGVSLIPHASATSRVIVGHTHIRGIWGNAYNVAMAVRRRSQAYALGGHSAQGNAVAVVYFNGAIQLFYWDPMTGSLYPSPSEPRLPGRSFFTSDPFVVKDPNDRMMDRGEEPVPVLNNYDSRGVR